MAQTSRDCYRILELNPDATLDAVKRSYRSLVKLWHPDRYAPGSSMQAMAQEKIKDINLAYGEICKKRGRAPAPTTTAAGPVRSAYASAAKEEPPTPPKTPRPPETAPPRRTPRATGRPETADQERPKTDAPRRPEVRADEPPSARKSKTWSFTEEPEADTPQAGKKAAAPRQRTRSVLPIVGALIAAGIVIAAIIAFSRNYRPDVGVELPPSEATAVASLPSPIAPQSTGAANASDLTGPRDSQGAAELFPAIPERGILGVSLTTRIGDAPLRPLTREEVLRDIEVSPKNATFTFSTKPLDPRKSSPSAVTLSAPNVEDSFRDLSTFTNGSSIGDVILVQGKPDESTDKLLRFGSSTVSLSNGRVVSWHNGDTPLKARQDVQVAFDLAKTFKIGSSKADVISVQGAPQHASETLFQYGSSTVQFYNDRVVSWRDGVPALKAHRIVDPAFGQSEVFTVGTAREQVIAIQGKPDWESDTLLQYGAASVRLANGKVVSWDDKRGVLKARVIASIPRQPTT